MQIEEPKQKYSLLYQLALIIQTGKSFTKEHDKFQQFSFVSKALSYCKQNSLPYLYRDIFETFKQNKQEKIDEEAQVWINQESSKIDKWIEQKELLIAKFKKEQNFVEVRNIYKEEGQQQMLLGDIQNAIRSFNRGMDWNPQGMPISDLIVEQKKAFMFNALIFNKPFEENKKFFLVGGFQESKPEEEKIYYMQNQLIIALKCMIQKDFIKTLLIIRNEINIEFLKNTEDFCQISDLANIFAIMAVKELPYFQLKDIFDSPKNRNLLQYSTEAYAIFKNLFEFEYKKCMENIQTIFGQFSQNPYLVSSLQMISEQIQETILLQFLQPFEKIQLKQIQETFLINNLETLESFLIKLILLKKINFKINPIEKTLEMNPVNSIQQAILYKKALKKIKRFTKQKSLVIMRNKLGKIVQKQKMLEQQAHIFSLPNIMNIGKQLF